MEGVEVTSADNDETVVVQIGPAAIAMTAADAFELAGLLLAAVAGEGVDEDA